MSKIKQSELDMLRVAAAELAEAFKEGPATRLGVAHDRFLVALIISGVVPDSWRGEGWGKLND